MTEPLGYGVHDRGTRFGGGDESADFGLCYPHGEPLTRVEAENLAAQIGQDATVVAFFDRKP